MFFPPKIGPTGNISFLTSRPIIALLSEMFRFQNLYPNPSRFPDFCVKSIAFFSPSACAKRLRHKDLKFASGGTVMFSYSRHTIGCLVQWAVQYLPMGMGKSCRLCNTVPLLERGIFDSRPGQASKANFKSSCCSRLAQAL